MDQRPEKKLTVKTIKHLEENNGVNFHDFELGHGFLARTPKVYAIKEKRKKLDFHQNEKHLCFKGYYGGSENTTHRMGEKIYVLPGQRLVQLKLQRLLKLGSEWLSQLSL